MDAGALWVIKSVHCRRKKSCKGDVDNVDNVDNCDNGDNSDNGNGDNSDNGMPRWLNYLIWIFVVEIIFIRMIVNVDDDVVDDDADIDVGKHRETPEADESESQRDLG